jgi:hypothetical protein
MQPTYLFPPGDFYGPRQIGWLFVLVAQGVDLASGCPLVTLQ